MCLLQFLSLFHSQDVSKPLNIPRNTERGQIPGSVIIPITGSSILPRNALPNPAQGGLKILLEVGTALRRGCAHGCSVSIQLLPAKCFALLGLQSHKDTLDAAMPGVLPVYGCCMPVVGAGAVFSHSAKKQLLGSASLGGRLSMKQFGCCTALFKLPVIIPWERIPTWRSSSGPRGGIL